MISVNYVNGSLMDISAYDPFNVFESELNDVLDSVHNAYTEYQEAINEYNLSVEFFESGDDTKLEAAEEKKANFVDKIGAAIIEVGKKAVAFINNIISKIQESLFANKSDMQKVSALCKKNPEMADDINKAFRDGNLQVADLRSIKELESAYDEIMKLAQRQDVDPNTLKGKWIKAKKKFGNLSESDIVKGAGIVVSGAAAATALVISIGKLPEAIYNIKHFKENANNKTEMATLALEKQRNDTQTSRNNLSLSKLKLDNQEEANNAAREKNKIDKEISELKRDDQKRQNAMGQKKDSADLETSRLKASEAQAKKDKAVIDLARTTAQLVKNSAEDLEFDINGLMLESASDAMRGVISSIHSDMMKVYTVLANFNFKNLSRAKMIVESAIKGYNKQPKTVDKKPEKEVEDEE